MSADELRTALDELRTARDLADGEAEERISGVIDRVENALEDDRTIDHGNLARMDRTLSELEGDASDEAETAIGDARDALSSYREGVPGA